MNFSLLRFFVPMIATGGIVTGMGLRFYSQAVEEINKTPIQKCLERINKDAGKKDKSKRINFILPEVEKACKQFLI